MASEKYEVSKHVLVPKHTKLTDEEAQKVLDKYNVTPRQLPKIHKNDPTIKDLDTKPGDIIEIERKSPTVEKVKFYRVVANA